MISLSDLANGPKMFEDSFGSVRGHRLWRGLLALILITMIFCLSEIGVFGNDFVLFPLANQPRVYPINNDSRFARGTIAAASRKDCPRNMLVMTKADVKEIFTLRGNSITNSILSPVCLIP
jgi:hypothetical protein